MEQGDIEEHDGFQESFSPRRWVKGFSDIYIIVLPIKMYRTWNFTNAKPENACKLLACIASVLYLKPKKSGFIMRLDIQCTG